MTSTISLSDDRERLKLAERKVNEEAASTSSSLIDLSPPKPLPDQFTSRTFQVDDAIPDDDLMLGEDAIEPLRCTSPDDGVNLLILESAGTEPKSTPEQQIRSEFGALPVETSAPMRG